MGKRAFAIACIPDDIECLMAGTLVRLREAGCETHTMNVAGGTAGPEAEARNREAYNAAFLIGAIHHESLVDGFDALYEGETTARLCAIFRETPPDILLIQWPSGHADERQNAARLAVTAAFCRGMRNFATTPQRLPIDGDVTIYHAATRCAPGSTRRLERSGLYVDVGDAMDRKRDMLACHSGRERQWSESGHDMQARLAAMETLAQGTGRLSGRFDYAEGWRRHNHLGFCAPDADPLFDVLAGHALIDSDYEPSTD
jgi:LmbE family N-acetylglucosaminyl deacetylase